MGELQWRGQWWRWGVATAALALCGCIATSPFRGGAPGADGAEPLYKVENRPGGFTIATVHERRGAPRETVEQACRQGLVQNANDLARSLGRSIQPIDPRAIRVRMSGDAQRGVTRCEGSVPAAWAP